MGLEWTWSCMVLPGEGSSVATCSVLTAEEERFLPGKTMATGCL